MYQTQILSEVARQFLEVNFGISREQQAQL
jgi:hypothetical protein